MVSSSTAIHMNTNKSFYTLLQIADSIFPIGSYTQSNGLETYVQKEIVKDVISAEAYLKSILLNNFLYNDFLGLKFAYEYAESGNIEKIFHLDKLLYAVKAPREMKQGSSKMCIRFIKLVENLKNDELLQQYKNSIKDGICKGQHSIAFGIFAVVSGIPMEYAVKAYFYNTASCIVSNCVKLIPLGQVDGQIILFKCHKLLEDIYVKLDSLTIEDLGRCSIGFDIRAMQHETLYSRLYMS